PVGNSFGLDGIFTEDYDDPSDPDNRGTYRIEMNVSGRYLNRPPTAVFGFFRPGESQGGCPGMWQPNPGRNEAEANGPEGLTGMLHSRSTDPDGFDIASEHWTYSNDGRPPLAVLAHGSVFGPITYGFDLPHRTRLLTVDRNGAASADECEFWV